MVSFGYAVNGIMSISCASIGLLLNLVAIFILVSNKSLHNFFNWLLVWLLCFDNGVLLSWTLMRLYADFQIRSEWLVLLFPYFIYPFCNIAQSASTFMTVALAHERYAAVQNPVKYAQLAARTKVQLLRQPKYAIPVIAFSTIYNIPLFFCYRAQQKSENSTELSVAVEELRRDPLFISLYINWIRLFISGAIPFSMLIFYNINLSKMIKQKSLWKELDGCMRKLSGASTERSQDKDRNITTVLFGIVILFLVCHR